MPANWTSLRIWLACETQWRIASGLAGAIRLGLDYAGVDVVLRRLQPADPDAVFADLCVMETAALAALSEGQA